MGPVCIRCSSHWEQVSLRKMSCPLTLAIRAQLGLTTRTMGSPGGPRQGPASRGGKSPLVSTYSWHSLPVSLQLRHWAIFPGIQNIFKETAFSELKKCQLSIVCIRSGLKHESTCINKRRKIFKGYFWLGLVPQGTWRSCHISVLSQVSERHVHAFPMSTDGRAQSLLQKERTYRSWSIILSWLIKTSSSWSWR